MKLPNYNGKNIIVTGGLGFLGLNLVRKLLQEGNKVIIVDNFLTSKRGNLNYLKDYWSSNRFIFENLDVLSSDFHFLFKRENIHQIYHLASPASPPKYTKFWKETMEANTVGTKNCLDVAKVNENKPKVLFASSSEVYGQPQVVPQPETYYGNRNSFGNRSLYDESKALGETWCFQYIKEHGVDAKIARIHNTYGPYMQIDDGRVVTSFIKSALENKPFNVFGDGEQYRCFTYVDDMVNGLILLMNSELNQPVNLGSIYKFTVNETKNLIKDLTLSKSETRYQPIDKDDPLERIPDLTLAESIGYKPVVSFREGLIKTIDFFKKEENV